MPLPISETSTAYISRYYASQHLLRGVTKPKDVSDLEARESQLYDRLILPYLQKRSSLKIVELASGPGIFLSYLKNKNIDNFTGIDQADDYINLCREQNLNVVQADVLTWLDQQELNSLDVIVAIDFVEHLDKQTFVELLDKIYKALKPGGIFIARAPSGDSPFFGQNFFNDITHQSVFTTIATRALVQMCGLNLERTVDEFPERILARKPWLYPLVVLVRILVKNIILVSTGYKIDNLSPNFWYFVSKT